MTTIGNNAFYGCTNLKSISLSNSITTLAFNTFYNCTNLSNVVIPDSVTTIENNAFYSCNLSNIIIPDSVTTIENNTFENCKSLTKIYIPNSVTTIEGASYRLSPFASCSSLIIYCESTEKQSGWSNYWNYYSSSAACATNYGYTLEQYEAELNS